VPPVKTVLTSPITVSAANKNEKVTKEKEKAKEKEKKEKNDKKH
jgi:hypothetical protein